MPRPRKCRRISREFGIRFFGPKGIPMRELEQVYISHDEVEALRLAELEKKYQEEASKEMGVSRATFGRTLDTARYKLVDAFINGKGIQVEGGSYMISGRAYGGRYWQGGRWGQGARRRRMLEEET